MNIETTPQILKDLVINTNSKSAMITSTDGLALFTEFNIDVDEDRIAASTAAVLSISQRMSKDSLNGELEQITFQTKNGNVIIKSISENAFITVITDKNIDTTYVSERIDTAISFLKETKETLELV